MLSLAVPGSPIPGPEAPDAVVVGSDLDIVDALLSAGMNNVVLACSSDAFRHAMSCLRGRDTLVIIDARARKHTLATVCRDPGLLAGRTVVIRGGTLDAAERRVIESAHSIVWCAAALPARTLVRLARLHRAA